MAVKLSPIFNDAQLDSNGDPLSGGKLYTYAAGTTTNQTTYTTSAGSTPQANPIVLNSRGEPDNLIWLTEGLSYKFVLKTAADVTIRTVDNVAGVNDSTTTTVDQWITPSVSSLTYVSATSFTVAGDQTSVFQPGRRIRAVCTASTIYGVIQSSTFGASTTVVVGWDSTQLDSGLSAVALGLLTPQNHSIPNYVMPFPASYRNKIIGGDFTTNPWQRGTSFTAPATGTYCADRWVINHSSDGVVNVLKTADAPTVVNAGVFTEHCLHVDVTTDDASLAAGQHMIVRQPIEGLNAASFGFGQAGTRYVTLSFWHKHTKTGTYCVALTNSSDNRSYVAEYTQAVADTWERAIITIPVDTSGTWLYTNAIGVNVIFAVASGSTYQTTAGSWQAGNFWATSNQVNALDNIANNFKLALIQLESGQVATPFEARDVGTELALCQRYLQRVSGGLQASTVSASVTVYFDTSGMRATPTVTNTLTDGAYTAGSPSASQWAISHNGVAFLTKTGTVTVNNVAGVSQSGIYTSVATWSAEANSITIGSSLYIQAQAEL